MFLFETYPDFPPQERVGQHTRDATIQGLGVAQQAANVAATARG